MISIPFLSICVLASLFGIGMSQSCGKFNSSEMCKLSVYIRSEAKSDPVSLKSTADGSSFLIASGEEHSTKSSGINVAVLQQKTGHHIASQAFDVAADANNANKLKDFIAAQPNNVIILLAVQSQGNLANPNTILANMGLNFSAIRTTDSFAAVLCKETGPYCKVKVSHRHEGQGPAFLSVKIPMDFPCLKGSSYRVVYSDPIANYAIVGPKVKTVVLPSDKKCKDACFMNVPDVCYMFNYHGATKQCELFFKDRVGEYSTVKKDGWMMRTRECKSNTCQNGGQCYSLGAPSHSACICKTGFTGANCQTVK